MSRKKSNATPFRFPFDIDSRVFLALAAFFFIWSIKEVNQFILPNTTPSSLAQKISEDFNQKSESLRSIAQSTSDFSNFYLGQPQPNEVNDLLKLDYTVFLTEKGIPKFWNNSVTDLPVDTFPLNQPCYYQTAQSVFILYKLPLGDTSRQKTAWMLMKIKNNYPFKSDFFNNRYTSNNKSHDDDISIALNKPTGKVNYEPLVLDGKTIFYLVKEDNFLGSMNDNGWHLFFHVLPFIMFGVSIHTYYKVTVKRNGELLTLSLILLTIIGIRSLNYLLGFPDNYADERLFSPELFASDALNRSLGDVFINVSLIFWLLVFFLINVQGKVIQVKTFRWKWPYLIFWQLILIVSTIYCSNLAYELINDTTINYDTSIFSRFDLYSFIGLLTFQILFANMVLLVIVVHTYFKLFKVHNLLKYLLLLISYLIFQLAIPHTYEVCYYFAFLGIAIIMFMLDSNLFNTKFDFNSYNLLLWFILISLFASGLLSMLITDKEKKNRVEHANSLLYTEDKSLENRLVEFSQTLQNDSTLSSWMLNTEHVEFNKFTDYLYTRYLSKEFAEYQHYYYLFDSAGNNLAPSDSIPLKQKIQEILDFKNTGDSLPEFVPYRNDNEQGYFFLVPYKKDSILRGQILCQIYSSLHFEDEEFNELVHGTPHNYRVKDYNYNVAIYNQGNIISRKGLFAFPQKIKINGQPSTRFYREDGYSVMKYIPESVSGQVIIAKKTSWLYLFTTLFAYIFFIYFVTISLYILGNIIARSNLDYRRFMNLLSLNLRLRVHVAILIVVFLSFIAVGYSTSYYLKSRTKDKLKSEISNYGQLIQKELNYYMKENQIMLLPEFKDLLQQPELLSAISDVAYRFNININIFQNITGKLIFSSSPDFFHYGLLSKRVNARAYYMLNHANVEQFIHNENIEQFEYFSSYCFLKNQQGENIGILQIPYISSNRVINSETGSILITLINIYVFVFLFSSILAFFITQRVTKQFTIIVKEFTKINLTKTNQPLKWSYNDEIGLLVKEYNRMLRKLENSSMIIAKNEREMAWREMAKQVAHEIKNPLTPMKLSLQMLERAIKNNNPNIGEMTARVTTTLIEQIDNLTLIATNFSNFAKMPELNKENFNLNEVLYTVTGMYNDDESNEFLFLIPEYPITVLADKSQLIRVVTNLIQNAIQAIPDGRRGNISLEVTKIKNNYVRITVSDNGEGIDPEKGKKLFQPYFTTKSSGTGLGLAMCKDIIEQFGGKIHFESTLNIGTDFFVDLPIADFGDKQEPIL